MAHFHVSSSVPGYLAECDDETVSSKREASRLVAERARQYREQEYDLPRSQRRTGSGSGKDGYILFGRPNDVYDLGLAFWWSRCEDDEGCELGEEAY
jgi:hypothetical protein